MLGGIVPTLSTGSLAVGVCAYTLSVSTAQASTTISVMGDELISDWRDGSTIAGMPFANGDTVRFESWTNSAATLGESVTAKLVLEKNSSLELNAGAAFGAGTTINNSGTLILHSSTVLGAAKLERASNNNSWVVVDWGNDATVTLGGALENYRGNLKIQNSAYTLTAAENQYLSVYLSGGSTEEKRSILTLANAEYKKAFRFEGFSELKVEGGNTAKLTGTTSGSGTLIKSGAGTLALQYINSTHNGTLDIREGSVLWGLDGATSKYQVNTIEFERINIASGAQWIDGHVGVNMSDQTDIYSTGGTIKTVDVVFTTDDFGPLTNYYRSLHVNGGAATTLTSTWKESRRFALLTTESGSAALVLNDTASASEAVHNVFDEVKHFNGTITSQINCGYGTNKHLVIETVDLMSGDGLTVRHGRDQGSLEIESYEGRKIGEGSWVVQGGYYVHNSFSMEEGSLSVSGALRSDFGSVSVSGGSATVGSVAVVALEATGGTLSITGSAEATATQLEVGSLHLSGATTTISGGDAGAGQFVNAVVQHDLAITDGASLNLNGDLRASSLRVEGGTLAVTDLSAGTASFDHAVITVGGALTVTNSFALTAGSTLTATQGESNLGSYAAIAGQMDATGQNVTAGALQLSEGASLTSRNLTVGSLDIGGGTLTVADTIRVKDVLTMNYGGTLNLGTGGIELSENIVLAYNSGRNLVDISGVTLQKMNLDLSALTEGDFTYVEASNEYELDLGISSGNSTGAVHIASLTSSQYRVEAVGETLHLFIKGGTQAENPWDQNWGAAVASRGASYSDMGAPLRVGQYQLGLYGTAADDHNQTIAATLVGGTSNLDMGRANNVFGGAYSTRGSNYATGDVLTRDVWMKLKVEPGYDNVFNMVAGGSYNNQVDESTTNGSWSLRGDVHIDVDAGVKVTSIAGGNVFSRSDNHADFEGDAYISVHGSDIIDSVIGGNILAGTSGQHMTHRGDTYLSLYSALSHDGGSTEVRDYDAVGYVPGDVVSFSPNAVIGGNFTTGRGAFTTTVEGDSHLVFAGFSGTTNKTVVGGNYGYANNGTQTVEGETEIVFRGLGDATFGYAVVAGNGYWDWNNSVTQAQTAGDAVIRAEGSQDLVLNGVIGGHMLSGRWNNTHSQSQGENTLIELETGVTLKRVHFDFNTEMEAKETSLTAALVGGSFYWDYMDQEATYDLSQTHDGNTGISLGSATAPSSSEASIVGGHYLYTDDVYSPANNNFSVCATQTQGGAVSISVTNMDLKSSSAALVAGNSAEGKAQSVTQVATDALSVWGRQLRVSDTKCGIIGGHFVNLEGNVESISQRIAGNVSVELVDSSIAAATYGVIGAGAVFSTSAATQTLEGSVSLTLDGVRTDMTDPDNTTNAAVVGGHVSNNGTSTIKGDIALTLTGGSYNDTVIGGTAGANKATCHDVSIVAQNTEFLGKVALIGGHRSSNGELNDVNITLTDCTVSGILYGGSSGSIWQGNISIELVGGTYSGDIIVAGNNTSYTGSTTLTIHEGTTITASAVHGQGANWVAGNSTLRFVDEGVFQYGSTVFYKFNYVDVEHVNSVVKLQSSMQGLGKIVNKVGEGTLELTAGNNMAESMDVREGTLTLPTDAAPTSLMINHLYVRNDAVLNVGNGGVSTRGELVLSAGSTLQVDGTGILSGNMRSSGAAMQVTNLVWGDQTVDENSRVTLDLGDHLESIADAEGRYTVALFTGLSQETIQGIAFTSSVGENDESLLWADAADYVKLANGDSTMGGKLWLKGETLYLTNSLMNNRYWTGTADGEWSVGCDHWHWLDDQSASDPNTVFAQRDAVFFTKDGTEADPATITLTEDITAGNMVLRGDETGNGHYKFVTNGHQLTVRDDIQAEQQVTASFNGSVTVQGDLLLEGESSLDFNNLSLSESAIVSVRENSDLRVGNDLSIGKLTGDGSGSTTVVGALSLANGSTGAGSLVARSLSLGGDTTFKKLEVDGVTIIAADKTLTVSENSSMGSVRGGSLAVNSGTTTLRGDSTLTALSGNGSVNAAGQSLTLQSVSSIGNLTAGSVTVGETLSVTGTLTTDRLNVQSLTLGQPSVEVGSLQTATTGSAVHIVADEALVTSMSLSSGTQTLLRVTTGSDPVTFNWQNGGVLLQGEHYAYRLSQVGNDVVVSISLGNEHYFGNGLQEENAGAGGALLDQVLQEGTVLGRAESETLRAIVDKMDELMRNGGGSKAEQLGASVAGSSIATVGLAFAEDMQRQLKSIRNRTTVMGVDGGVVNEGMPYYNAWINAEGSSHQFGNDGTKAGYSLNSFGGTVGFDVDVNPSLTCGLALTALTGDFTSDDVDKLEGDLDTQYLTAFARYVRRAWTHTLVFSVGRADVSADRTVTCEDLSYKTKYDSDGMAFGFLYELGRVFALNESHTACIQPLVNVMWTHSSVSGAEETGSDAGLKVDDMTMDTLTLGAGARVQALVGEDIYNRSSILEARALLKLDVGDRQGEADVAFAALNTQTQKVKSAEAGPVGLEIGAGITIPVGPDSASVFADASLELRSGYVNGAGTVGFRVNF